MKPKIKIKELLKSTEPQTDVVVKGWIRSVRCGKATSFIQLNDGSSVKHLQVVVNKDTPRYDEIANIGTGACIAVTGDLVESLGKEQRWELSAKNIEVIGQCPASYPLQKKQHSFEFLRTIAHLRPRSNTFGSVFRVRSELAYAIHDFFHKRGFLYIHTPIITASDCEGAGEMFLVTTLDIKDLPRKDGDIDFTMDFFKKKTGLTVSGQLEGELFALAFSEIYTFGPTFRAENSNTPRHASEFWMIEPEMAFYDLEDNMKLAEDFIKHITNHVLTSCPDDMKFFDEFIEKGIVQKLEQMVSSDFKAITYTEAIEVLKKSKKTFEFPVDWGVDLQKEHERYLTEEYIKGPVFIIDYPRKIKAFYMRLNEDGNTVRAMDLLVPSVGEIIGGSQREERAEVLKERITDFKLNAENYQWYMDSRIFGSAPHSGFGLGFERALMYITGMANIRDVIPFPRVPGYAEF